MTLPTYPADPGRVRRCRYTVPQSSPTPALNSTPDAHVLELVSVTAMRIGVQAPAGKTFTGSGTLRMHYLDSAAGPGDWGPNPSLDIPMPPESAGLSMYWLPDVSVLIPAGRMHIQTDAIGLSNTGDVTIFVLAWVGA